jgi:predicted PurR-regulated permease PerM
LVRGRPFLVPIIWGAITAIAVFHGYDRLQSILGCRRITAAMLVTLSIKIGAAIFQSRL